MNIDRFWLLAARQKAGEATPAEEQELRDGLTQNPDYRLRYDALTSFWGNSKQQDFIDSEKAYLQLKERIFAEVEEKPVKKRPVFAFLKVAAVLLLGASLVYAATQVLDLPEDLKRMTWATKQTQKGERTKILLPDGSLVWLNADSRLAFPEKFSTTREVSLAGEAFFDVVKDPQHPFVIHLNKGDIRVLGTSFNVKSFADEHVIETSVVSGKVAFIPATGKKNDTLFITQNTKAIYNKDSGRTEKLKTVSIEDRAWTDGKMIFHSATLSEVAKVLERTYGKKVILENASLKNCKLTGTFQENTLEEITALIAATKDYQFKITEKELRINGAGCPDRVQQ